MSKNKQTKQNFEKFNPASKHRCVNGTFFWAITRKRTVFLHNLLKRRIKILHKLTDYKYGLSCIYKKNIVKCKCKKEKPNMARR